MICWYHTNRFFCPLGWSLYSYKFLLWQRLLYTCKWLERRCTFPLDTTNNKCYVNTILWVKVRAIHHLSAGKEGSCSEGDVASPGVSNLAQCCWLKDDIQMVTSSPTWNKTNSSFLPLCLLQKRVRICLLDFNIANTDMLICLSGCCEVSRCCTTAIVIVYLYKTCV